MTVGRGKRKGGGKEAREHGSKRNCERQKEKSRMMKEEERGKERKRRR